jgi:uncharacterized surface protein with fasciclin (FAS1) repeats
MTLNRLAAPIAIAMALGPLTALSLGTKLAGEETWERATAGVASPVSTNRLAAYDSTARVSSYVEGKNLLDVTEGAGLFDQFEAAIKTASLEGLLSSDQPYTLFLPVNDAFARMTDKERVSVLGDPRELRELVESHIVPGRVSATDLMRGGSFRTLNGKMLTLQHKGDPTVENATIVKTENAENGVVHIIDAVLES